VKDWNNNLGGRRVYLWRGEKKKQGKKRRGARTGLRGKSEAAEKKGEQPLLRGGWNREKRVKQKEKGAADEGGVAAGN